MTKALFTIIIILCIAIPVAADEIVAPEVPSSGYSRMPQKLDSFADALWELIQRSIREILPEWESARIICAEILACAVVFSLLPILSEKTTRTISLAGAVILAGTIFQHTNGMIGYASKAVWEICEYGKLLCPVLTTGLAAQGGITASAALYTGTTAFITLLSMLISKYFIPMVYLFLACSIANGAFGEEIFKRLSDAVKSILHWLLKALLIIFTTYMSITGVVSGVTDAAALKATKLTMSTVVPVVGGILSDASESVMISMGVLKNAAGMYGIFATLSVFMGPFIKVGIQYLLLKISALICGLFASKNISGLVDDFSSAMGLLLAMVATGCVLVLISTVCFMKGIG